MAQHWKFIALIAIIIGTLAWLAVGGISDSMTYYKTIPELQQMGAEALGKKLRVGGDVEPGSIRREGTLVRFILVQEDSKLPVVYVGTDPLPDTFRDGAQALVAGRLRPDGVFEAQQVQAKCASKYEATPEGAVPAYSSQNR